MQKLTKSFLEKLVPADGKQLIIRDSELPGFGVRLSGKTKSWIVEKRVVGVNRRITFGNYPAMSCEEARQEARKILADIRTGVDPASAKENERIANLTLQEVLNEFLEHRNLKYWSRFSYRSAIERHLSDWLQLPVRKITRDMVEDRHKAIPGPTRCGTDGKVRANTTFQILRCILRWAADHYQVDGKPLLESNPVSRLTVNRQWYQDNVRQGTIPDNRLAEFYRLVMLQPKIVRDYILLLLHTGLRRAEGAKLRWADVDFGARTLTVPAGFNKSKRDHVLPMSDFVYAILESRQGNQSEFVFPGRYSGHLIEPRAPLARLRAEMGWNWMFHDLRRTCLSAGEKVGVPFLALQKIANHCVRREVTDRYLVLDTEFLRPHMQNISDHLLEQMHTTTAQWQTVDKSRPAPNFTKDDQTICQKQITSVLIVAPVEDEEEVYF